MADEDFGPVIDGMRDMTAQVNAAFAKVEERDREAARVLLGAVWRGKQHLRRDVARLEELVGAEVAAEFEAIADDLAAGPEALLATFEREHREGFRGRR